MKHKRKNPTIEAAKLIGMKPEEVIKILWLVNKFNRSQEDVQEYFQQLADAKRFVELNPLTS